MWIKVANLNSYSLKRHQSRGFYPKTVILIKHNDFNFCLEALLLVPVAYPLHRVCRVTQKIHLDHKIPFLVFCLFPP